MLAAKKSLACGADFSIFALRGEAPHPPGHATAIAQPAWLAFLSRESVMGILIFLAIIAVLVFWAIGAYNRLVDLRNRFKNAFAQIDVQLKRRYDLIPNLVETAKAYMKHERETLEAVIRARSGAVTASASAAADPGNPVAMAGLASAEGLLGGALGKLFALAEAYPELKADQNMLQLTEELTGTENRIGFARQAFNDAVMTFNTAAQQFPSNLIASIFSFKTAELLAATESADERKAVKVQF
jgi:LemA protein